MRHRYQRWLSWSAVPSTPTRRDYAQRLLAVAPQSSDARQLLQRLNGGMAK